MDIVILIGITVFGCIAWAVTASINNSIGKKEKLG